MQTGHSSGGVDGLRNASGLFRTHSRVNEGVADAAAAALAAPVIASFVLARLALEIFLVMVLLLHPPEKKTGRSYVV